MCVCVLLRVYLCATANVKKVTRRVFLSSLKQQQQQKSTCLCKSSQERHPGCGAVKSLPPVKIKYETFIIQGGLIWRSLSDGLCNGEALNGSTFTALKGWRGDPKGKHYVRKQKVFGSGGETLRRVLPSLPVLAMQTGTKAYYVCVCVCIVSVWEVCLRSQYAAMFFKVVRL